jgi:hypothetical protein
VSDRPWLVIPDLQIPFEHPRALEFCKQLAKHYGVPKENVLCVGDETDQYFGSLYEHDPDAKHTPASEIAESIERLREWYAAFPICKVAISNHGVRWARKASSAGIPSVMMRSYKQIIEAPNAWTWEQRHVIDMGKAKVILTHGMEYGGKNAIRQAVELESHNVVFGHHHSVAGVIPVVTPSQSKWAMGVGCLIDVDAYAFAYGKYNRFKPCLGAGVIFDGGRTAHWIPLHE